MRHDVAPPSQTEQHTAWVTCGTARESEAVMQLFDEVDKASLRTDIPAFRAGDTVNVHVKVVEGTRSRVQIFKGIVIRRHGGGIG